VVIKLALILSKEIVKPRWRGDGGGGGGDGGGGGGGGSRGGGLTMKISADIISVTIPRDKLDLCPSQLA
jgi:hypothetical protein